MMLVQKEIKSDQFVLDAKLHGAKIDENAIKDEFERYRLAEQNKSDVEEKAEDSKQIKDLMKDQMARLELKRKALNGNKD